MRGKREDPLEVFGPFRLYERLGTGGTANVFRATRVAGDGAREISLKRLHAHLAADERTVAAFLHEARLAALMDHANMCRFVESGEVDGQYFIAMEYIDGTPLNLLLREASAMRRPPPLGITLSLISQLCEALDYAHNRVQDDRGAPLRVVHRDISPSNLVVRPDGVLKLIDLGIAKARITEIETEIGVIKGKLAYMAPEVVAGEAADQRADIFAAGIVAWELLTARRLFPGATDVAIMDRVLAGGVRPPSTWHHACPPQIDDIVMRALAYRKDDRWSSAAAMQAAVRAAAAFLHEPITREVVASWLDPSRSRHQAGFEGMRSDAITLVRVRPPSPPRRFPSGTVLPLEPPTATTRQASPLDVPPPLALQAPVVAPPLPAPARPTPLPGVSRVWALVAGASLAINALVFIHLVLPDGPAVRGAAGDVAPERAVFTPAAAAGAAGEALAGEAIEVAAGLLEPIDDQDAGLLEPIDGQDAGLPVPVEIDAALPVPVEVDAGLPVPVEVDAAALARVSGPQPRSRSTQEPFVARVCLDAHGRVEAVVMLDGPERLRGRVERALGRWRYRPHQVGGLPVPACFVLESELSRWRP